MLHAHYNSSCTKNNHIYCISTHKGVKLFILIKLLHDTDDETFESKQNQWEGK